MSDATQLHHLLTAATTAVGLDSGIRSVEILTGGCIHTVRRVEFNDGTTRVAKITAADHAAMLDEEAAGLVRLAATGTVRVPGAIQISHVDGQAILLMEALPVAAPTPVAWRRLGEDLAALHRVDAGTSYGLEIDNHLGLTPQPNTWCDDWVEFNAASRLGHQVRLARSNGGLTEAESAQIDHLIGRLARFLPRRPRPSLLHGDLWSGNAVPVEGDRIAIIDPACSVGDGWADIAMMRLFGGFDRSCLEAYASAVDDHDGVEERIAVYQLYHLLNHVTLFGRGYTGQAMGIVARLA